MSNTELPNECNNICSVSGCENHTYYTFGHLCYQHMQEEEEEKAEYRQEQQLIEKYFPELKGE